MGKARFSIAGLMGVVLVAAVGLAALKNASETWAGVMLLLTCGLLGLSVVGALYGGRAGRTWWLGFCVFGGTYMALSRCWSSSDLPWLPTTDLLKHLVPPTGVALRKVVNPFCGNTNFIRDELSPEQIAQCLWTLLAALLGALLARSFFAPPSGRTERRESDAGPTNQSPRDPWLRPTVAGMAVLIPLTSIATIGSRSNVAFWAGTALLSTCALIGLAILGAVFRRGRQRAIWLGAALFGAGCLIPVLVRPVESPFVTDQLLGGFRPWLAPIARTINPANAAASTKRWTGRSPCGSPTRLHWAT